MICESLYGKLEEKSCSQTWQYFASFIANGAISSMDDRLHNSQRMIKSNVGQILINHDDELMNQSDLINSCDEFSSESDKDITGKYT